MGSDDNGLPDISRLDAGDTARVEYVSQRSGNSVEREGEVAEVRESTEGRAMVYILDSEDGFLDRTYVLLTHGTTTSDERCVAAVSISTEPGFDPPTQDDPPKIGRTYPVSHSVARKQTLGIVQKVIRVTPLALEKNEVL